MKTVTLILLGLSLSLIIISAEIKTPFVLYIAVFGLLVSFLCMVDILIIQPKQKSKNNF
jgi:Co/Zn/Cd efflux system component